MAPVAWRKLWKRLYLPLAGRMRVERGRMTQRAPVDSGRFFIQMRRERSTNLEQIVHLCILCVTTNAAVSYHFRFSAAQGRYIEEVSVR